MSRLAVQQTIDYNLVRDPGPELARFDAGRQVLIDRLAAFFEGEQKRGNISTRPMSQHRRLVVHVDLPDSEVRRWLRARKAKRN